MAKKVIRDERLKLDIVIDGNKGQMELGKLEDEARKLNQQVKELGAEMGKTKDKDSDAYKTMAANRKELNSQLDANRQKQTLIRKELGLNGLTYKQLGQEAKRLQLLLSNSTYGSEQWKKLDAELRRVKGRMSEVRGGAQQTGFSIGKMATGFNKYFTMVSAFALSITGLIAGIRKAYLAYAEFDDKIADVMKTTGLTKDQVKELNKEFDKIDTRSSQEDLMNLARIAGKLGVNASEDVLGFVRAADKINVALSEDLGGNAEDAIRELGKLTDIFKLKDTYGMEQSLIKIGSTINALGAASTANEPYLVEFAKRLAGIAPSVDMNIQNVLGLAATLDQLGQTSEVSSTVMAQLLPKMFKETATYAGIAKMSVSEFSTLLNTDTNEAMIRVFEGLSGNNEGFEKLVHTLGDMGMEGKRTISVLGVLANNTDLLRQQQQFANVEFEKGTSILDEFNVKNETARAGLDKAVKVIQRTWRELGEKLAPAIRGVVSGGTMLVRSLTSVVDFFIRFGTVIKTVAVSLGVYVATVKIVNNITLITTKLTAAWAFVKGVLTGKINLATIAMNAFNKASRANIFGLIAAGVAALVTALISLRKHKDEATKSIAEFNVKAAQERKELDDLFGILKRTKEGTDARKAAIDEINKTYGQYLPKLLTERSSLNEIETAQRAATRALIDNLAVKMKSTAQSDLVEKRLEREADIYSNMTKKMDVAKQALFSQDWKAATEASAKYGTIQGESLKIAEKYGMKQASVYKILKEISDLRRTENWELQKIDSSFSQYLQNLENTNKSIKTAGSQKMEVTKESLKTLEKQSKNLQKELADVNSKLQKTAAPKTAVYDPNISYDEMKKNLDAYNTSEHYKLTQQRHHIQKQIDENKTLQQEIESKLQVNKSDAKAVIPDSDFSDDDTKDAAKDTKKKIEELQRQAVAIKKSYESLYEEVAYIEETEYTRSLKLLEDKFEEQKKIIATAQTTMIKGADGKMSPIISPEEATRTLELIEVQYFNKRLEIDQKEYERLISVNAQKAKTEEEYQVKIQELREQYVQRNSTLINYEITLLEEQHSKGLVSTEEYTRKLEELNIRKNNISLQFDKQVAQEQLKHLTALHSQKLVSTEEYTARSIELNKRIENIQSSILSESSALQLKQLTELNTLYSEKKKEVLMTDEEYHRRSLEITENTQNLTQQEVTQSLEELNQKREQSKVKALQIENEYQAEMRRILSQSGSDSSSNVLIQQLTELNTLYSEKKKEVLMTDEEYHRQSLEITTNSQNLTQQEVTKSLEELNQKREQSKVKSLQIENEYQAEMRRILLQSSQEDITLEESLFRQLQSLRRSSSEEGMAVLMTQLTELHNTYIDQQEKTLMSEEEYSKRKTEITENSEKLTKEQVTEELKKLEEERETRANKALVIEQEYWQEKQEIINKAVQDDAELKAETERQEKLLAIRRQYGLLSNAELMKEELDQLEEHYKNLGEKDEAYYKVRAAISSKYAIAAYTEEKDGGDSTKKEAPKFNFDLAQDNLTGADARSNLEAWHKTELEMIAKHFKDKEGMEEIHLAAMAQLEEAYTQYKNDLNEKATMATLSTFANMFGVLAGMFEQGSAEWKAFSIFQVTISTATAAIEAYKAVIGTPYVGPILAPIAAAAAVAFGIQQITEIANTEPPKFSSPQYYTGHYDVLGEQTGKRYQAKYKGKPETGYVSTPSLYLAGDDPNKLKEMIVSGPDLQNPMIADYAKAILDIKANRQPVVNLSYPTNINQSGGGYQQSATTPGNIPATGAQSSLTDPQVIAILGRISSQLENPTRAKVVYSDLEEAKQKMDRVRNDVRS